MTYELHKLTHKHIFKHIYKHLLNKKKSYTETFLPNLQLACMKWVTILVVVRNGKEKLHGVNMSVVSYIGKF